MKLTDKFLIVNEKKLNNKFVHLNLLGIEDNNYKTVKCDKTYDVCVGLTSLTDDRLNPFIKRESLETTSSLSSLKKQQLTIIILLIML